MLGADGAVARRARRSRRESRSCRGPRARDVTRPWSSRTVDLPDEPGARPDSGRSRRRRQRARRRRLARRPRRGARRAPRAAPDRRADRARPRLGRRLPPRRRGAAAGRGDAGAGRRDLGRDRGPAPAAARLPRRDLPARRDAERDARPARRGPAPRAALRRRRGPRAADAAGAPPDRARAGAPPPALAGGARGRAPLGRRRRSIGSRGSPRTCSCSRRARTERCRSGAPSSRRASCSRASRDGSRRAPTSRDARWRSTSTARRPPGDRLRLEQALGNLVDNALRHGAGPVTLGAEPENGELVLRVSDEGDGFPPEFLPHAFERFSRADEARPRGGAGLGLAIVDAVARAHGG